MSIRSLTSITIHSIRELGTWVFLRNDEMEQCQITPWTMHVSALLD